MKSCFINLKVQLRETVNSLRFLLCHFAFHTGGMKSEWTHYQCQVKTHRTGVPDALEERKNVKYC